MIRYSLCCAKGHSFESWFQSAEAFDTLKASNMVVCPDCGSTKVQKELMVPGIKTSRKTAEKPFTQAPETQKEHAINELRKKVEEGSDYVGMNFASEARAIHDGDAPERSIWGEAKVDDAKALIDDGIPVAPLPFRPKNKTN